MSTQLQLRRGTTAQTGSFTGAVGEVTIDTDKKVAVVHDGSTAGGLPGAALHLVQSFSKAQRGSTVSLTSSSASIAVDASLGNNFTHTFTENTTLANPTNLAAGQSGVIVFTQHASSPKTLAFGSYWKFPGGTAPTVTATNSAVDVLAYYVESTTRITARLITDVK